MLAALLFNVSLMLSCPSGSTIAPTACDAWHVVRSYRRPVPVVRHGWTRRVVVRWAGL